MAISGDRILAVGRQPEYCGRSHPYADFESVGGRGKGFAWPHRLPHAPGLSWDRAAEFELRSSGAGYESYTLPGAVSFTVTATRAGNEEDLRLPWNPFGWMLEHGTTTAEAKSGYGLDRETELKSLRAIRDAGRSNPVDVHPTFLGAHTVPAEFDKAQEYVEFAIHEVLPEAASLARFADVSWSAVLSRRPRRSVTSKRAGSSGSRSGCTLTNSRAGGIPLALDSAREAWTTSKPRGMKGPSSWRIAMLRRYSFRVRALPRPSPPLPAVGRRGRDPRAWDRFQPR